MFSAKSHLSLHLLWSKQIKAAREKSFPMYASELLSPVVIDCRTTTNLIWAITRDGRETTPHRGGGCGGGCSRCSGGCGGCRRGCGGCSCSGGGCRRGCGRCSGGRGGGGGGSFGLALVEIQDLRDITSCTGFLKHSQTTAIVTSCHFKQKCFTKTKAHHIWITMTYNKRKPSSQVTVDQIDHPPHKHLQATIQDHLRNSRTPSKDTNNEKSLSVYASFLWHTQFIDVYHFFIL